MRQGSRRASSDLEMAMTETNLERRVSDWLDAREGEMISMLRDIVNIDSGSYDKAGVDAVGDAIRLFLERHAVACETIPLDPQGDILRASVRGVGEGRPVMLLGHRDTVFPKGEAARRPFSVRDGRAYGPGVADMKAGLVMNAFVLAAFQELGGAPAPLIGLFTGDEEIGSPGSRAAIEAQARDVRAVFNAEPGRPNGAVVTGRKGGIFFEAEVFGKAAHSGVNFQDGVSAIAELARKILAWTALTDLEAGTTVNVGLMSGGQSVNTVAPHAVCQIDLRYVQPGDRDRLVEAIRAIAERCDHPMARGAIAIRGEFLPLAQSPASKALFDAYVSSAAQVGFAVDGAFTGGCADSGFTAGVGAPTLCAVGPVGGGAHSPGEYLDAATIVPRAKALALTVLRLGPA